MSAEIYRQTKLGDSLVSALEVLVESDKITAELAIKVLSESYLEAIKNSFKAKTSVKGKLDSYRFCDNVWTFIVSDAKFKTNFTSTASTTNAPEVTVDKVQIVCVDAKVFDAQP
ncbi:MAG: transcription initiation factor IIA gamma chain [Trebouxia sp. A1-2]|nr:MAG: transcription initiation factor IIA gamma chain [Trebouxia sp. A1-2]